MSTAIAVFCKTPGLSPVKTRLSMKLGRTLAEEFYRLSVLAIKDVVEQAAEESEHSLEIYWALAEQEGFDNPMWNSHKRIWTGEGSLGNRIHHVYEELLRRHEQVIIIGSDSPQMTAGYIRSAMRQLRSPDLDTVIGPCRDGGFVLFGSKRLLQESVLTKVNYSREDTLQQLTDRLKPTGYRYHLIPCLGDVDQYDDLVMLLRDFRLQRSILLPGQQNLYQWLQRVLRLKHPEKQVDLKPYHNGFVFTK